MRRLKGADRPLVPESERVELLEALECVDLVVPFEEDTPERLIAVFDVLMFPWPATHKFVRGNAWAAILLSFLLFLGLVARR